jgi:hypothetical protein
MSSRLRMRTEYVGHKLCYPNVPVGKYKAIQDYKAGESVGLSGDLKVGGELLHKEIATIEAETNFKVASTGVIIISPLAIDDVDWATLYTKKSSDPNCQIIGDLLNGNVKGAALTQAALHGRVAILLTTSFDSNINAEAKGELLKKIAGAFKISEAEIRVAANEASFSVSESPNPMTLAIVPSGFSFEELARITQYMQGKRGADLEIAVREAITAGDVGLLERWRLTIEGIFGNDELKNKERWAENVVGTFPVEKFRDVSRDTIDFEKVATYAAAMELVRLEAPPQR